MTARSISLGRRQRVPDAKQAAFWSIYPLGNYSEERWSLSMWSVDFKLSYSRHQALLAGESLKWKSLPANGVANRVSRLTDLPITDLDALIVSERARRFLEKACPADIQFIPATILSKAGKAIAERYWAVNCLHLLDCADKKKSKPHDVGDGRLYYPWLYVAASKVPRSIQIFRVLGHESKVVIRASLAMSLSRTQLTGVQFMAVDSL